MRHAPTPTEELFWRALTRADLSVAFKRQVPVGLFIVDFLAPSVRLVVEVDGGCHSERRGADAQRDRKLRALGYRVVRVDAELVVRDPEGAVQRVRRALGIG
jgi:very-short-patch-repair endonuclease